MRKRNKSFYWRTEVDYESTEKRDFEKRLNGSVERYKMRTMIKLMRKLPRGRDDKMQERYSKGKKRVKGGFW